MAATRRPRLRHARRRFPDASTLAEGPRNARPSEHDERTSRGKPDRSYACGHDRVSTAGIASDSITGGPAVEKEVNPVNIEKLERPIEPGSAVAKGN
jgi:hypothetical protein